MSEPVAPASTPAATWVPVEDYAISVAGPLIKALRDLCTQQGRFLNEPSLLQASLGQLLNTDGSPLSMRAFVFQYHLIKNPKYTKWGSALFANDTLSHCGSEMISDTQAKQDVAQVFSSLTQQLESPPPASLPLPQASAGGAT